MILVDTGPLVALFDPKDDDHAETQGRFKRLSQALVTTVPVLTEAFHLLGPDTRGAQALRQFLGAGGMRPWFLGTGSLHRAFELMDQYSDQPMDLADASLVAAAEVLRCTTVFTIDRRDFMTYRARIGRTHRAFRLV